MKTIIDLKKTHTIIMISHNSELVKAVLDLFRSGVPILCICLGFQILTISSQEAEGINGLGLLPFETKRLKQDFPKKYKIPHIGWNSLYSPSANSKLLKGIPINEQLFYFLITNLIKS